VLGHEKRKRSWLLYTYSAPFAVLGEGMTVNI